MSESFFLHSYHLMICHPAQFFAHQIFIRGWIESQKHLGIEVHEILEFLN